MGFTGFFVHPYTWTYKLWLYVYIYITVVWAHNLYTVFSCCPLAKANPVACTSWWTSMSFVFQWWLCSCWTSSEQGLHTGRSVDKHDWIQLEQVFDGCGSNGSTKRHHASIFQGVLFGSKGWCMGTPYHPWPAPFGRSRWSRQKLGHLKKRLKSWRLLVGQPSEKTNKKTPTIKPNRACQLDSYSVREPTKLKGRR